MEASSAGANQNLAASYQTANQDKDDQGTDPKKGDDDGGKKTKKDKDEQKKKEDQEKYEEKKKELDEQYPKKKDKIENHHIDPQYLGGPKTGPTVPLPGSYHQGITNEFRNEWGYGQGMPTPEQLESIKDKVYRKLPLPTNIPNSIGIPNSTRNAVNASGVGIGIGVYIVYKAAEAVGSIECGGCLAWLTP